MAPVKSSLFVLCLLAAAVLVYLTPSAVGQSTRCWVSGVGDDANPCSRTAPCKTFAGAISKTSASGEIDVLDPGGFGSLTITQSITIDGSSALAGVLISGTNGFVINAPGSVVVLRKLDIQGTGGLGLSGIRILSASAVYIDSCNIVGFRTAGIEIDVPPSEMQVFISNSHISNNNVGILQGSNGASSSLLQVNIDSTTIIHSNPGPGVQLFSGQLALSNSIISQNVGQGILVSSQTELDLFSNQISGNQQGGVQVRSNSTARIVDNSFSLNTPADVQCADPLTYFADTSLSTPLPSNCSVVTSTSTSDSISGAATLIPSLLHFVNMFF